MSVPQNRVFRNKFSETKVKDNSVLEEDGLASNLWTEV